MATPAIHVIPRPAGGWAVEKEGAKRAASVHSTQADAAKAGRAVAKRSKAEFILHGRDGKIRSRDSYGNDPHPPKG